MPATNDAIDFEPDVKKRELRITLDRERYWDFVAAVDAALNSGWQRNYADEERSAPILRKHGLFCYCCDARGMRPKGTIAIRPGSPWWLTVTRVRSDIWTDVSCNERNAILLDFNETVLRHVSHLPFNVFVWLGFEE